MKRIEAKSCLKSLVNFVLSPEFSDNEQILVTGAKGKPFAVGTREVGFRKLHDWLSYFR